MSGTGDLGSKRTSSGRQTTDYARLGQFVGAVVDQPFGAQPVGVYCTR